MSSVQVSCVIFIADDDGCQRKDKETGVADSMRLKKEGIDILSA